MGGQDRTGGRGGPWLRRTEETLGHWEPRGVTSIKEPFAAPDMLCVRDRPFPHS